MSAYTTARLDEIASEQWPHWMPIRHHFGITTFGINAWRGGAGDTLIPRHGEEDSGAPELYLVMSGHAAFDVGGDDIDAPAGTLVWVADAATERSAAAKAAGTVVLSVGAAAPGRAYEPSGWDSGYLEGA